jgi:large subunit ribosomal protein L15
MIINDVHQGIHKRTKGKRIGRGPGSGWGKTSTRGHKGEGSRNGSSMPLSFQGGQTPLFRRTAKRGFNNYEFAYSVYAINLNLINDMFNDGDTVCPTSLKAKGKGKKKYDLLKILGDGEVTKALTIHAHKFSVTAEQKILAAGGKVEYISTSVPQAPKAEAESTDAG